MWVTCAICGYQYFGYDYITDTRTFNICTECRKTGYTKEVRTSDTTNKE